MRLSEQDARYVANRLADDAVYQIEQIILHDLDMTDAEALGDDLANGFMRVIMSAEIYE